MKTVLKMEDGNELTILAKKTSDKSIYIQSARLNGKPLDRCWLHHSEIVNGGTLEFEMGAKPSSWASSGELPPSMSTGITL